MKSCYYSLEEDEDSRLCSRSNATEFKTLADYVIPRNNTVSFHCSTMAVLSALWDSLGDSIF